MRTPLKCEKITTQTDIPMYYLEYDVPELGRSLTGNYSFGLLIGEKAGGEKTKMRWTLKLAPSNQVAPDWNDQAEMTSREAIAEVRFYAERDHRLEQAGLIATLKFTTQFGLEQFITKDGSLTYDLNQAQCVTWGKALSMLEEASATDYTPEMEGDRYIMVTAMDAKNASYGASPKYRHFKFEELEAEWKEHREARK